MIELLAQDDRLTLSTRSTLVLELHPGPLDAYGGGVTTSLDSL